MAVPMSVETAGYKFTPRQAKITSALEGLAPFSPVTTPSDFTRDVAGAYSIADDQSTAPALALADAFTSLGQGAVQGFMGREEQRLALEAEERKHQRDLEIESIKSARSSEALQKRIEYLREAAETRLREVGGKKKPPRRMVGEPPTVADAGTAREQGDGEEYEGETYVDPNLNIAPEDIPVEPLLPEEGEEAPLPPIQQQGGSLFNLTPPQQPFMPGAAGTEDIPPIVDLSGVDTTQATDVIQDQLMRIDPQEVLKYATVQAGGVPPALPGTALTMPLTDLSAPINVSYIPSETERQLQEMRQQVRGTVLGRALEQSAAAAAPAPLAQMPAPAPTTEFPAGFQPGAYRTFEQARQVAEMPLPEQYERPVIEQRVDPDTGETFWEVMPPAMKSAPKTTSLGPDVDTEQKLRKEFIAASKEYMDVQGAWGNIKSAAELAEANPESQGAADLALIFSYMKLLDPGSVVREGEFANAQNAAGVPDRIRAQYNQLMTGGRLAEAQRKEFVRQGKAIFNQRQKAQNQLTTVYRNLAEQSGLRPEMVAIDLKTPDPLGDVNDKIRAKVASMTNLQRGTEEYNAQFKELTDLLKQKRDLQLQLEQEIAVD